MSEQTAVPTLAPEDATPDPTYGWDGARAASAGLQRMAERPPLLAYVRDLWERREFVLLLPMSTLRQQHMNTVLGSVWHLLSPMLMSGVYYLVFGVFLGARGGIENYAVYLVAGVLTYRHTQKCIQSGAKAIVNNEKMLTSLKFPAAVLPISSTLTELFAHGPALLVLCGFALVTGESPLLAWLLLIPVALGQAVFNTGLSLLTARVTVHFRDTEEILQYVLRLGFYLSGVIIGPDRIPDDPGYDWIRTVYDLNPFFAFIQLVRGVLTEGVIVTDAAIVAGAWSAAVVLVGFVWFWRHEGQYGNVT